MKPPLHLLDNTLLVTAYKKAIDLQLDETFISLLEIEMKKRDISNPLLQEA